MRAATKIAFQIVEWFRANQRDLPWRRTRDPYAIWVSEIMLQQTQVKTVIPYWERWMRELPDVRTLAKEPIVHVLKLWEGLGYYSRARNMQAAARQIVARHGGRFPTAHTEIFELPGVGRYTAGAIASIAYGEAAPILDGNVIRVLARYFGLRGDPKSKLLNAELWALSGKLVTAAATLDACSELNQGLMELGALVCLPREANCGECPLHTKCVARRKNLVAVLPETAVRPEITVRKIHGILARRGKQILLRQRADGFWELPNWEVGGEKAQADFLGGKGDKICEIKHSVTRFRVTLEIFESNGKPNISEGKWRSAAELAKLPLATPHRRALEKAGLLLPPME